MSPAYLPAPVTLSTPSMSGIGLPTTVCGAFPSAAATAAGGRGFAPGLMSLGMLGPHPRPLSTRVSEKRRRGEFSVDLMCWIKSTILAITFAVSRSTSFSLKRNT